MDAIEDEVKTMENNITKIRTILSATDTENISPEEHLENMQVLSFMSRYPLFVLYTCTVSHIISVHCNR